MRDITIRQFYEDLAAVHHIEVGSLLPRDIQKQIGHFNIFNVEELLKTYKEPGYKPGDTGSQDSIEANQLECL